MPTAVRIPATSPANGIGRFGLMESKAIWFLAAAVGAVVWFGLPATVIVFNDDFGYLRSIVATLQHGRPWTDDWLEPWAASLSAISACVYTVTGNFRIATYGVQAGLAGLIFLGLFQLLRERKLGWPEAACWALAGVSFPTLVWKLADFGAVPLYGACLLVGLWAAGRNRWVLFAVAWLIALSSRQSALPWLALPAGILIEQARVGRVSRTRAVTLLALLALVGVLGYWTLNTVMNPTYARQVMMPDPLANLGRPVFWRNTAIACGVFLLAAGVGQLAFAVVAPPAVGAGAVSRRPGRGSYALLGSLAVAGLWWFDLRGLVEFEHPYWRSGPGTAVYYAVLILALVGWWMGRRGLRWPYALTALALAGMIGLRDSVWEYYLLDVAVLGFFGVGAIDPGEAQGAATGPRRWLAGGAAVLLLGMNLGVARQIKQVLDFNHGAVVLCESALRSGSISPVDLSGAPFGLQGWHLYPRFIAEKGGAGVGIASFANYLRPGAVRIFVGGIRDPDPSEANGGLARDEVLLLSQVEPWSWAQTRRFHLIRRPNPPAAVWTWHPVGPPGEAFPLNNREWTDLIDGGKTP